MIPEWFSLIDGAFVVAIMLFAWGGFQKGFAGQVAHILTFLFLSILLFFGYPVVFRYLNGIFDRLDETVMMWILLAVLVILSIAAFKGFAIILSKLLKMQISDRADQINGLILGVVRGGLTALVAMILLAMVGPREVRDTMRGNSYVGRFVCMKLVPRISPHLSRPIVEEKAREIRNLLLQREEGGALK